MRDLIKKKVKPILCIVSCFFLTVIASGVIALAAFDEEAIKTDMKLFVENWFTFDFDSIIETYGEQLEEQGLAQQYQQYADMQKLCGELKETGECVVKTDNNTQIAEATVIVTCELMKIKFTGRYDSNSQMLMDENGFTIEEYNGESDSKTSGGKLKETLTNTVMSIMIIFCVLVFISGVIGLLKYVSKAAYQVDAKKEEIAIEHSKEEHLNNDQINQMPTDENSMNDLELVAVITAAIAAANETVSTEGLIVRSIRRRS